MTNEKKFSKGIVVEKNEDFGYILELWGASTKHPDSTFYFCDWEYKNDYLEDEEQVYQWLLYCASMLIFPFYAKELVDYANKEWYNW